MSNKQRNICIQCRKAFRLYLDRAPMTDPSRFPNGVPARSVSISNIDPSGKFCTLRCAARFGTNNSTFAQIVKQGEVK
jgi:hypothetical protein